MDNDKIRNEYYKIVNSMRELYRYIYEKDEAMGEKFSRILAELENFEDSIEEIPNIDND